MMLTKMFISFLISNWLYAEICYFFPSFDDHAKRAYQAVQLPTHDKWNGIANSSGGRRLGREIYVSVKDSGLARAWPVQSFLDPRLTRVWQTGSMRSIMSLLSDSGASYEEEYRPFYSEEGFFVREDWHPMQQYAYRRRAGVDFVEVESVEALERLIPRPHRGA